MLLAVPNGGLIGSGANGRTMPRIYGVPAAGIPAAMAASEFTRHTPSPRRHPSTIATRPASRPQSTGPTLLFGQVLRFNVWSENWVKLPREIRVQVGTDCRRAYIRYRTGAFDRQLPNIAAGDVKHAVRLLFSHNANKRLCSTISGALELTVNDHSLTFRVQRQTNSDARAAIRQAERAKKFEVSAGSDPLKVKWTEPTTPDKPGHLDIIRATLNEISLVDTGAMGSTFAYVL